MPTIGPHSEPLKTISVGVAAHISAASGGGPRFNADLTNEQRLDIENGIWLCQTCSRLIDMDEPFYTTALLKKWKSDAENQALRAIHRKDFEGTPDADQKRPYADGELIWIGSSKQPQGLSTKTNEIYGDTPISIRDAIWYNHIKWRYDVKIYNNSSVGLFNLKVTKEESFPAFRFKDSLPKVNNLEPYRDLVLKAETSSFLEGTGEEAMAVMEPMFPENIQGLKLLLEYTGENRKSLFTRLTLKGNELEIIHLNESGDEK